MDYFYLSYIFNIIFINSSNAILVMALEFVYTLLSVILVSVVSLVGIFPLIITQTKIHKILLVLVGLAAGTLLGDAFIHLLPEVVEKSGFTLSVSLWALAGIFVFFILEKGIHAHHYHNLPVKEQKRSIGGLILLGDGLHNFLDGLAIAGSYLVSIPIGIATTIAVILHEIPQEVADFGVLLHAGFTKWKALGYNFISAATAVLGALIMLLLPKQMEFLPQYILPFAAGGFIYIAGATLIPELHHECGWEESLSHILAVLLGIGIMALLLLVE